MYRVGDVGRVGDSAIHRAFRSVANRCIKKIQFESACSHYAPLFSLIFVSERCEQMLDFIQQLKIRNEALFYFGLVCIVLSFIFLGLTKVSDTRVYNVSAWYKPFKFACSIFLFAWSMAWYCSYLPSFNITLFNWVVILLLGFEIVYIAIQAGRGQLSHYNVTTPLYSGLYAAMGAAATLVTLYTAYVGILFFTNSFPGLPLYYVWAIRLAILLFVVFSLEGAIMGGKLTHTIGGADGGPGIPLLHWSTKFGDPRIAHFIGMHALQVLPVLSFYVLKSTKATIIVAIVYAGLATFTLVQALNGKPFFRSGTYPSGETLV